MKKSAHAGFFDLKNVLLDNELKLIFYKVIYLSLGMIE